MQLSLIRWISRHLFFLLSYKPCNSFPQVENKQQETLTPFSLHRSFLTALAEQARNLPISNRFIQNNNPNQGKEHQDFSQCLLLKQS